jgi:hypothetical protein
MIRSVKVCLPGVPKKEGEFLGKVAIETQAFQNAGSIRSGRCITPPSRHGEAMLRMDAWRRLRRLRRLRGEGACWPALHMLLGGGEKSGGGGGPWLGQVHSRFQLAGLRGESGATANFRESAAL